jgi:hypothetical protein
VGYTLRADFRHLGQFLKTVKPNNFRKALFVDVQKVQKHYDQIYRIQKHHPQKMLYKCAWTELKICNPRKLLYKSDRTEARMVHFATPMTPHGTHYKLNAYNHLGLVSGPWGVCRHVFRENVKFGQISYVNFDWFHGFRKAHLVGIPYFLEHLNWPACRKLLLLAITESPGLSFELDWRVSSPRLAFSQVYCRDVQIRSGYSVWKKSISPTHLWGLD